MAEGSCGICLDDLKNPVSTPCGHLHCENCLISHVEANSDAVTASCPSCRTPFSIATPDLRFVPAKYHKYIIPSVRRVFFDAPGDSNRALKATVVRLEERVKGLESDKTLLMERCEASMVASSKHAEGERDARMECEHLRRDMRDLRKKYDSLKGRYREYKEMRDIGAPQLALKRKSTQASLDGSTASSSPSTLSSGGSSRIFRFGPHVDEDRPMLRIPKRPRLLGSPFDPTKAVTIAPVARPAVFRKGRTSVLVSLQHGEPRRILDTPEERSGSSALDSGVGSSGPRSVRPQRSGLPMGDLFSPDPHLARSSSVDFSRLLDANDDDVFIEDESD